MPYPLSSSVRKENKIIKIESLHKWYTVQMEEEFYHDENYERRRHHHLLISHSKLLSYPARHFASNAYQHNKMHIVKTTSHRMCL